jgi:CRISPR-associated endonuclease Cas3-HD
VGADSAEARSRVVAAFLDPEAPGPARPSRLIYAAPTDGEASTIHREARRLVLAHGGKPSDVTVQTVGEPGDPFFERGRIVVTTADLVLRAVLGISFGVARRQRNVNLAALVGALVVFDAFERLDPDRALLTAIAQTRLFRGLTQSVWLSQPASPAVADRLARLLGAELILTGESSGDGPNLPPEEAVAERESAILSGIRASWTGGDTSALPDLIDAPERRPLRVLVADWDELPERPTDCPGRAAPRAEVEPGLPWRGKTVAWYWDLGDQSRWRPLRRRADLRDAEIVCLAPAVACRAEPLLLRAMPAPTRHETWAEHAFAVARRIAAMWESQGQNGLAAAGFRAWYDLSFADVAQALRAGALLHDLGKLQQRWQSWAAQYQRERDPTWVIREPLARTGADPEGPEEESQPRLYGRGPHALASAWYGRIFFQPLLAALPHDVQPLVASACAAAIVAHHGSWLPAGDAALDIAPLAIDWLAWAQRVTGFRPTAATLWQLNADRNQRGTLAALLDPTTSEAAFAHWLPFVAFLTRMLRLADRTSSQPPL